MNSGWIKLHRRTLENPIIKKPYYLSLWIILLLKANHEEKKMIWNGDVLVIKEGQLLTGRKQLAKESGIPETTIERILDFLEKQGQIGQQKTNKYRLITIVNWKTYQEADNKRTTSGQQADTNKKYKNIKKNTNTSEVVTSQSDHPLIVKVFDAFVEFNPAIKRMYGNTTQRGAIKRLLETHGLDRLLQVIAFLPKSNKIPYLPTITTPLQLEDKWLALESGVVKKQGQLTANGKGIA